MEVEEAVEDELLFKQPESNHLGDCPICLLPISIDTLQGTARHTTYDCCSKVVCNGCIHANLLREREARLPPSCPFCRTPEPKTDEEIDLNVMKRVEVNDPVALHYVGLQRFKLGEYEAALEFWKKAAALEHTEAPYHISCLYDQGLGVEKDAKKCMYHLQLAAIGGHVIARFNLGVNELKRRNMDRAVKHFIIAANQGCDDSLGSLKKFYARGMVSKEDFGAALRAHYAAVNAAKSPQRNEAEAAHEAGWYE